MLRDYTLQTTWGRALVALAGGAVVGATVLTAYGLFGQILNNGAAKFFEYILETSFDVFMSTFFLWTSGLLFFGIPAWLLVHLYGYRTWHVFLIFGIIVAFMVGFVVAFIASLEFASELRNSIWTVIRQASQFAVLGPFVGLTIWHIAYRRPSEYV